MLQNKPLAAAGLTSYRYRGNYGFIMIGANSASDALKEASRSTGVISIIYNLEIYVKDKYYKCIVQMC